MDMFNLDLVEELEPIDFNPLGGMKIFDFHPLHLFLNTPSEKYYKNVKKHFNNIEELKKNINTKKFGVLDLFKEVVSEFRFNDTLSDLL